MSAVPRTLERGILGSEDCTVLDPSLVDTADEQISPALLDVATHATGSDNAVLGSVIVKCICFAKIAAGYFKIALILSRGQNRRFLNP